MKNVIKLTFGMLLISLVLTSCKKKDDNINDNDKPTGSYFKIDNTEYQLSAGILDNYGTTNPNLPYETHYGYEHELYLYSSGISIVEVQDDYWDVEGEGNEFFIRLYSTNGLTLDNGTYTYFDDIPRPVGTWEAAEFYTDENKYFKMATGELKVSKTNNTYTITISGTTDNGKTITGYYKGSLRYFDHTGYDKKSTSSPSFYPKEANLLKHL